MNKQERELIQPCLDLLRSCIHLNNRHFTNVTRQGTHPGTEAGALTPRMGQRIPKAAALERRQRQEQVINQA